MSLALLAGVAVAGLLGAYAVYGRLVARQYRLDDDVVTPAVRLADGEDFVPTAPFYLFGQHFSAIAAAGPIVGPIAACLQFGWLPCLLWILAGGILIGAVHDFSALVASVRHQARSIAEIVKEHLSHRAWVALMLFIWLALVYVIVAFTDVTASTFVGRIEELDGVPVAFNAGGAVAFASVAYLTLALVMGVVQRVLRPPLWLTTIVFVPGTLGVVWLGTVVSDWLVLPVANPQKLWGAVLLAYCFVASLLPVWLLLQPRGYLGGFVLYLVLAAGVVGVFWGDFTIAQPAFKGFAVGGATGALFPFLFVTIACGACSGFHGLVCGGTTSKQIALESHCRPVGYGAMLCESFVALIALVTVMIALPKAGTPAGAVYGQGIGQFLAVAIGREHLLFAVVFGTMAFSTFIFDTLDVATRLGRYIVQELFGTRSHLSGVVATAATVAVPLLFVLAAPPPGPGRPPAYMAFWTLFGTSNQLLAALTLVGVTVWLKRTGRPAWFTYGPMAFVLVMTVWALVLQAHAGFTTFRQADGSIGWTVLLNGCVASALLGLAGLVVLEAVAAMQRPREARVTPAAA
jgi:carbon starvation protein